MRLAQIATFAGSWFQRAPEPDEQQLLKLFWNRAEVKKELARLQREREKLIDQVRQQEGVNLRAQQRLEQLENLLGDPTQAANAAVYYQLRGVWAQSRRRLQRLSRELAERQQEREERHARRLFEQRRDQALSNLDEKIASLAARLRVIDAERRSALAEVDRRTGFWNHFRRRRAREQVAAIEAAVEGQQGQIERLEAERRALEHEPLPPFPGLSVEGRRNVNLAVIALAQQILVELAEHNVAGLAREASVRPLAEIAYGSVEAWRGRGRDIDSVTRRLDAPDRLVAQMRRRAEFLRQHAQYRRAEETIPVASACGEIPVRISDSGECAPADDRRIVINVLADDYWDLTSVLLS